MARRYAPTALVAMYTFFVFTFSKGIEGKHLALRGNEGNAQNIGPQEKWQYMWP